MDLAQAKRLGELATEIEQLETSLGVCLSGLENKAWVLEIRATDEGECERSFKFPLPPHVQLVQDVAYTKEMLDAMVAEGKPLPPMTYRAIREQAQVEGQKILKLVKEIIEAKLAVKHKEMVEMTMPPAPSNVQPMARRA